MLISRNPRAPGHWILRTLVFVLGAGAFLLGVRVEHAALRWAGIAILLVGVGLRFLRGAEAGDGDSSPGDPSP
jgi:hypothetical protein